jgi:hypothetical protein
MIRGPSMVREKFQVVNLHIQGHHLLFTHNKHVVLMAKSLCRSHFKSHSDVIAI